MLSPGKLVVNNNINKWGTINSFKDDAVNFNYFFLPVHFGLLLNNILCVLVMFNDSLFTFNHVVTLYNSLLISSSSKDTSLPCINILVSPANMNESSISDTDDNSLIYSSKNSRGPIIDPCGTPHVILLDCDYTLLYFINC